MCILKNVYFEKLSLVILQIPTLLIISFKLADNDIIFLSILMKMAPYVTA
jgi:hypothetical protein